MPKTREKILLSWSGGKDCAMALWELSRGSDYEVVGLVAGVTEGDHRISMHGTPADLYLDDIRDFREEALEAVGMRALFPLWHRDTKDLSYAFCNARFKAIVTCVAEDILDADFAGRPYDRQFLADLPLTVDPCGENGEFHTFVYDGPTFAYPLQLKQSKQTTCADQFHLCNLAKKAAPRKASAKS